MIAASNRIVRLFCICLVLLGLCLVLLGLSWPTDAESSPKIIVIDPGHGGAADAGSNSAKNKSTCNNATSATLRIKEKDLTLMRFTLAGRSSKKTDYGP
jgi:hypothetical protein